MNPFEESKELAEKMAKRLSGVFDPPSDFKPVKEIIIDKLYCQTCGETNRDVLMKACKRKNLKEEIIQYHRCRKCNGKRRKYYYNKESDHTHIYMNQLRSLAKKLGYTLTKISQ